MSISVVYVVIMEVRTMHARNGCRLRWSWNEGSK